MARFAWAPDNLWGRTDGQLAALLKMIEQTWGQGKLLDVWAPSLAGDDGVRKLTGRAERASATPGAAQAIVRMNHEIDVRHVLPTIRTPTLVLHRTGDLVVSVEHGRYIARKITGAKYVEFTGPDHLPWVDDTSSIIKEVEDFLAEHNGSEPDSDRILATVLFADIVGSTELAAKIGDRGWLKLLEEHHKTLRQEVDRYRGQVIDTAGDGLFAAFDGPARAVRCGQAITGAVKEFGVQMRAGIHTGECERAGKKLAGMAVHIGARVMSLARPNEVLVSSTVKDLVAGSGLRFESRGLHALKGVEGEWNLFAAH
jgi:class 3 adenylate cyclase